MLLPILTLHLLTKRLSLKPKLKVKQFVGMAAKSVFLLNHALFVKVQILRFRKVFAHVRLNKLMPTLQSATPARMELTGIRLRSIVKNVRLAVLHAKIFLHRVQFANQTM